MKMKFLLLIMLVFASDEKENALENDTESEKRNGAEQSVVVKIEEDEYVKLNKTTKFIGVAYNKIRATWCAVRWSKTKQKTVNNGCYKDEETAAHASDTLARKLIVKGEKDHKLNFPDDDIETYREKNTDFIGAHYNKRKKSWSAQRWSKNEKKSVYNGYYKDIETTAHASDTLARKLIANGEKGHKINFPDDDTEVYPKEKSSDFIGVTYKEQDSRWCAQRWSKKEKNIVHNGCFKNEKTAAHASDTLARQLMEKGEKFHKLNFPEDDTEVYPEKRTFQEKKRKRTDKLGNSQDNKSYQN